MRAQMVCLLLMMSLGAFTQVEHPWEAYLNEVMTAEDVESETWERTYELLCELEQHPLDINRVSREQLEQLPFLSAQQIEELMEYLDRYGPIKSLGELRMIRSLDDNLCRLLSCLVYVDEAEVIDPQRQLRLKDVVKYGHHELMGSARIPFYERKGDREGYLGYPYRHWLRYQFGYGDEVKLGLVAAQDAGEPFFTGRNRWGYDYYSPYLQLRHVGCLETLVLGNYRVSMGMGLVMNNGFSLGKVAMLQTLGRSSNGIRAHASRTDNYLQGAATSLHLGKALTIMAFLSWRAMDGTLNKDSTVSTILDTGYHRTETEMGKKHNLHALKTGGTIRFQRWGFHVGVNALYTHLDRTLKPNTSVLYREHYAKGTDFMNTSLDYGYACHRVALHGETAIDKEGHLATVNSLSWRLSDEWSMVALQRFYSYSYTSLDAQSYSDGGRVQNESGVYIGLNWQPSPKWRMAYYADYAYFPWAKYRVSFSSHAWDHLLQMSYSGKHWTIGARYRLRMKQQDNQDKTALDNRWAHRARLSVDYSGGGFGCRTQLDGGYCAGDAEEWGVMVSQSLSYTHRWLRLNAGLGYFHTTSYDSRVYVYEQAPLYTYAMMQLYGEGIRYWLMARVNIGRHLMLTAKWGVTDYFDRNTIGSSYQQIDASSMSDLDVQLRWKF